MSSGVRDAARATRSRAGARLGKARAIALLLLGSAACTEIGSDPQAAVAIQLSPLGVPSVVVGDTLRDTTGAVVTPDARAINVNNEEINGAPIR